MNAINNGKTETCYVDKCFSDTPLGTLHWYNRPLSQFMLTNKKREGLAKYSISKRPRCSEGALRALFFSLPVKSPELFVV